MTSARDSARWTPHTHSRVHSLKASELAVRLFLSRPLIPAFGEPQYRRNKARKGLPDILGDSRALSDEARSG
jgi:hypothetical protein